MIETIILAILKWLFSDGGIEVKDGKGQIQPTIDIDGVTRKYRVL